MNLDMRVSNHPEQATPCSHADLDEQTTESCEGRVFFCEVWVSSSVVWGWGAAAGEPHPCTPAAASGPVPEAAPRTAAPPAGRSAALEDCS